MRYLAEKDRPAGPATPDQMTVAGALEIYGTERASAFKDPARIGFAIAALVPILGSLPVGSITGEVIRRHAKARPTRSGRTVKPGTIRKERGVLQAALNYCHGEGSQDAAREGERYWFGRRSAVDVLPERDAES